MCPQGAGRPFDLGREHGPQESTELGCQVGDPEPSPAASVTSGRLRHWERRINDSPHGAIGRVEIATECLAQSSPPGPWQHRLVLGAQGLGFGARLYHFIAV